MSLAATYTSAVHEARKIVDKSIAYSPRPGLQNAELNRQIGYRLARMLTEAESLMALLDTIDQHPAASFNTGEVRQNLAARLANLQHRLMAVRVVPAPVA